jgi:glutamate transport system permease protein
VLIATSLIPSAFCSEYLMAGMNTIAPGQIEAARSLGMTFFQIIKNVVLPQALRSTVLQLTNLLVATMLTTALASQVPLNPTDLTGIVSYINTHAVGGVTAFLISALLYCFTAVIIGQFGNWLDRKVRILR